MLFNEIPKKHKATANQVKRPDRNKKERDAALSQVDLLDLMGVNNRGHKRRRGAWRQA